MSVLSIGPSGEMPSPCYPSSDYAIDFRVFAFDFFPKIRILKLKKCNK